MDSALIFQLLKKFLADSNNNFYFTPLPTLLLLAPFSPLISTPFPSFLPLSSFFLLPPSPLSCLPPFSLKNLFRLSASAPPFRRSACFSHLSLAIILVRAKALDSNPSAPGRFSCFVALGSLSQICFRSALQHPFSPPCLLSNLFWLKRFSPPLVAALFAIKFASA